MTLCNTSSATPCYNLLASPYMQMHSTCLLQMPWDAVNADAPSTYTLSCTHHAQKTQLCCHSTMHTPQHSFCCLPRSWVVIPHSPATLQQHAQHPNNNNSSTSCIASQRMRCHCLPWIPITDNQSNLHNRQPSTQLRSAESTVINSALEMLPLLST
jgi:hypothetical protein